MNLLYLGIAIGGVFILFSCLLLIARTGGGLARPLLLLSFMGCLLAGAFVFARLRPASVPPPSTRLTAQSAGVTVAPTAHIVKSKHEKHIHDIRRAHRDAAPRPGGASQDTGAFGARTGDGISFAQAAPRAKKEDRSRWRGVAGTAVAALAVIALLYVGYMFLDAGTRGQFTWLLRLTSVVAFAVICVVVAMVRQRM